MPVSRLVSQMLCDSVARESLSERGSLNFDVASGDPLRVMPAGRRVYPMRAWRIQVELCVLRFRALALDDQCACHALGAILATGDHGQWPEVSDEQAAARWYLRAARRDHAESQYDLGWMLLLGEGTTVDVKAALDWLTAAAESGYSEAIRLLADLYKSGKYGVTPDDALATHWAARLCEHLAKHPEDRRAWERKSEHTDID